MRRHRCIPREHWKDRVEEIGLTYHSHDSGPYWDESICYQLTASEVDSLELAANELHYRCIDAAEAVITRGLWDRLCIPEQAVPAIVRSWERDDFSVYGRFDFAFDGSSPPKLLEYNADTPTALVEAAVAQWFWLGETHRGADQFNSIHERLISAWRRWGGSTLHFCSVTDNPEDEQTVLYLRDTCEQAGVRTIPLHVEEIGWDSSRSAFVDLQGTAIGACFKLYPWEWMWAEEFGARLKSDTVRWIEPTWKMLLSNKGILPILWELFPGHPNLLPCHESAEPLGGTYVRKPKLSREGSNVTWTEGGITLEDTGGDYGAEGFVYQAPASCEPHDGHYPVFGVWVVDHEAAGLGIREDNRRITGNLSRFVPHFFA